MNKEEKKQQIIDLVVETTKKDLNDGDSTALETLLSYVPLANLISSLPEKLWGDFKELFISSKIREIKDIIEKYGELNVMEMEIDSSPMYNRLNKNHYQVIEGFSDYGVTVTTYVNEIDTDGMDVKYEDLSADIIDEVYDIIVHYDMVQQKTYNKMRDENY